MSHQDAGLYKSFALVLGALVLFTLFIIVVANMASPPTDHSRDPLVANSLTKQIEPVGRSNVRADAGAEEAPALTETAATDAAATDSAATESDAAATDSAATESKSAEAATTTAATATAETTESTEATAAGSDDSKTEEAASEQAAVEPAGVDNSVEIPLKVRAVVATNCAGCHANGVKGAQRNDDTAAWQGLADKGLDALTASVINGLGEMPARAESTLDDSELKLAVQHMINKNLAGTEQSSSATESATGTATETATASAAVSTAATETAAAASTDTAATETVEIPDNVKAAVDTLCAACHISGVGNAPKYGDKDAWAARMANGLDAVTASAIAGKGAMPARGGSQLTDEEIRLAVQYMVTK